MEHDLFKKRHGIITKVLFCLSVLNVLLICPACSSVQILSLFTPTPTYIEPTSTATNTPEPTATIEWFPATATPLPLNTPTLFPTEDYLRVVDEIIDENLLADDEKWQTFRSNDGNIIVANDEITLAIQDTESRITSFASLDPLYDYYISAEVTVSLCQWADDYYGLIFRSPEPGQYYMWRANCLGQTSLVRVDDDRTLTIYDWAINGQIKPGAPQRYSVGILADGPIMMFFLNDEHQYEVFDNTLSGGTVGLTAASEGFGPLTVSFSEMKTYSLGSVSSSADVFDAPENIIMTNPSAITPSPNTTP